MGNRKFIVEIHEETKYKILKKVFTFIIMTIVIVVNKIILRNNDEKPQIAP